MSTWGRSSTEPPAEPSAEFSAAPPEKAKLERVASARSSRFAVAVVGLICLMLAVALIKPWQAPRRPGQSFAPFAVATAAPTPVPPTPTPEPTINPLVLAVQRRQCQSPDEWRLVTAERSITRDTRTMYAASPVEASGPNDPAISLSHLYALGLHAVGVCVPRFEGITPEQTLLSVRLWQIAPTGFVREINGAVVTDPSLYRLGEAYWAPPEGGEWPAGRYVFEIRSKVTGADRWMGLEFDPVLGDTARPRP